MPKLPVRTGKQVLKVLLAKGFVVDHVTGSHHILVNSDRTRRVTVPVHTRDVPKGTLREILKQAGVSAENL
jgi:predicted RNA binding protein YcfA (HicA-like mRNA interferase family)